MKKVSELERAELDYWVAKSAGLNVVDKNERGLNGMFTVKAIRSGGGLFSIPAYSTDWSQGGPIIERERISVMPQILRSGRQHWLANLGDYWMEHDNHPLIAAMRCFVASKFGETVE